MSSKRTEYVRLYLSDDIFTLLTKCLNIWLAFVQIRYEIHVINYVPVSFREI
jgi:hypothetical protein